MVLFKGNLENILKVSSSVIIDLLRGDHQGVKKAIFFPTSLAPRNKSNISTKFSF